MVNNSALKENKNDDTKLQVPKLIIKMKPSPDVIGITKTLRQVRRNTRNVTSAEQSKITDESTNTISTKQIPQDPSVPSNKDLKDISENMKDSFERGLCSESPVCIKRKVIFEKNPNAKDSFKNCYAFTQDLNRTEASEDTLGEQMYLITGAEFKEYIKLRKNDVLQKSGKLKDQNLKKSKGTEVIPPVIEIIDLDPEVDTEKLNQERLNLALGHSEANKTLIRALQNQMSISTSSETIEESGSTRASTPFPLVVPNFANIPARINTPVNVFDSTSNVTPACLQSSGATLSNSQNIIPSPKRLVSIDQQASPQENDSHDELRNEVDIINQRNDKSNEVNLNTLAETANSQNKLNLPPNVAALKQDYKLLQNQLAQRQSEKAREPQSHRYTMHPSQLLPPKPQPRQQLAEPFQPPKMQPPLTKPNTSQQQHLLQTQPPYSQPIHQERPIMHEKLPQALQVPSYNSESTQHRLSNSQASLSQQLQTLHPEAIQQQAQQLSLHYFNPSEPPPLPKSHQTQLSTSKLQLRLQQPPPLPPPQHQPQMQLKGPSYSQPSQIPHSQWAQKWPQNFYYTPQHQDTQQNEQYIQRQHNYSNVSGTQHQRINKAKVSFMVLIVKSIKVVFLIIFYFNAYFLWFT